MSCVVPQAASCTACTYGLTSTDSDGTLTLVLSLTPGATGDLERDCLTTAQVETKTVMN